MDVVLAAPFKKKFRKIFNKLFSKNCLLNYPSFASLIRNCSIDALIRAWDETCSISCCTKAAEVTGTFPQDLNLILSSPFVHELTDEEKLIQSRKRKQNRLNINGKHVNSMEVIQEINTMLKEKEAFCHLCLYHEIDYVPLCHELMKYQFHDVNLFSNFHPYMSEYSQPIFFE